MAYVTQIITQLNNIFTDKRKVSCDFAIPHQVSYVFKKQNVFHLFHGYFILFSAGNEKVILRLMFVRAFQGSSCAFCNPQIVSYFLFFSKSFSEYSLWNWFPLFIEMWGKHHTKCMIIKDERKNCSVLLSRLCRYTWFCYTKRKLECIFETENCFPMWDSIQNTYWWSSLYVLCLTRFEYGTAAKQTHRFSTLLCSLYGL